MFLSTDRRAAGARAMAAVVLLLSILGVTMAAPAPVGAHGELVASSPTPGEDVGSVVHIDLVFSTPVFEWSFTVDRPDGEPLDGTVVEKAPSYLSYEVSPLTEEGQYIVRYSATDSDGDLIEGAYAFTFAEGEPSPAELPVDLSVLLVEEGWPWWNYLLLFVGVVIIAVLGGLLAEKVRRLRAIQATN